MTPQDRIMMWNELLQTEGWQELCGKLDDYITFSYDQLTSSVAPEDAIGIAEARVQMHIAQEIMGYPINQRDLARAEMDEQVEIETEVS